MSGLHRKYRKIPWNKPKFFKIMYCGEGQETTVNGNQGLQSSWLYAKQASAVKTLTAINWSCWVKFFPCPINYGTVNFVFMPARHSCFWMTALSIKESVVTAVQSAENAGREGPFSAALPLRNTGTHQHLNQYERVNYWGSTRLKQDLIIRFMFSTPNGWNQYEAEYYMENT